MAKFTAEQIKAEAEKLTLTLTEDQLQAYAKLDRLPAKDDNPSSIITEAAGGEDGEPEVKEGDPQWYKDRIKQIAEKRRAEQKALEAANKKIADFEALQTASSQQSAAAKGEWEKLKGEAEVAKKAAETTTSKMYEAYQAKSIQSDVSTGLLAAGIDAAMLPKALKLFDLSKIKFDWANKEAFEYDLDGLDAAVESFKKDNLFFFEENDGDPAHPNARDQGRRRQQGGTQDAREAELKKKFPGLN